MKKVLPVLVLISSLALPAVALAVTDAYCSGWSYSEAACKTIDGCAWWSGKCVSAATAGETSPEQSKPIVTSGAELLALIERIGNWIFAALLALAGIFLIVAGFLFVTASGSAEQITKARQMLTNALIGVVIALGAKGLIMVIRSILGG